MEARAKHEVDIDYMAEHFLNMEFRLAKPWTLSADDKSPISHKEFALYKETTSRVLQSLDRNYSLLMQENKVRGLAFEQLQARCAALEHDKALQAQRNAELEQRCAQVNKQLCDQEDRLVLVEEDLGKVLDDLDAVKLQANSSLKRNAELEQRCADLEKELEGSRVEPVLTQVQQPVSSLSEVTKTPGVGANPAASTLSTADPHIGGSCVSSSPPPPRWPRHRWSPGSPQRSPRPPRWSHGPSQGRPGPPTPWCRPFHGGNHPGFFGMLHSHGRLPPGLQRTPGTFPWEPWSAPWLTHHPGGNPIPPWLRIPYWNCREIPDIIC